MPALINGLANLGMMSRYPTKNELRTFQNQHPRKRLVMLPAAFDALIVIANPHVRVKELSTDQLRGIFGDAGSGQARWSNWSAFGGEDRTIRPLVFSMNSRSYALFKDRILKRGDYTHDVRLWPTRGPVSPIVANVAHTDGGIGFGTMSQVANGLAEGSVRQLQVIDQHTKQPITLDAVNLLNGTYPIGRVYFLVMSTNDKGNLPKGMVDFLRFIYSKHGQQIVYKSGSIPLPELLVDAINDLISSLVLRQ